MQQQLDELQLDTETELGSALEQAEHRNQDLEQESQQLREELSEMKQRAAEARLNNVAAALLPNGGEDALKQQMEHLQRDAVQRRSRQSA